MPQDDTDGADDPLTSLYVDKDAFNRERLANSLRPYIGIDPGTGEPVFRGAWRKLSGKEKTTAYLLYRRASAALGDIPPDEIGLPAKDVAEETGLNYNSVRSYLSTLHYVDKSRERGGYFVPAYGITEAIDSIGENDDV